MVRRGWTGSKAGRGFYQKQASGDIEALDFARMEYPAVFAPSLSAIDAARTVEDPAQRIGTLFKDPGKWADFYEHAGANDSLRRDDRESGS